MSLSRTAADMSTPNRRPEPGLQLRRSAYLIRRMSRHTIESMTLNPISPNDWHDSWKPCPPGWEPRWQQLHDIAKAMTAALENGAFPQNVVGAVAAQLGFTTQKALEESEAEKAEERAKNLRQHDSILALQETVEEQRTTVPWDHLERETQLRLMAEANKKYIEETQAQHKRHHRRLRPPELVRAGVLPFPTWPTLGD
jgi:hypothetical protein